MSILIRSSEGEAVVDEDWIDDRYGSEVPWPDVRWRAKEGTTYSADLQVVTCPAAGCSLDDEGRALGTPSGEPCQADLDIPANTDQVEWRVEFDVDGGSCTVG